MQSFVRIPNEPDPEPPAKGCAPRVKGFAGPAIHITYVFSSNRVPFLPAGSRSQRKSSAVPDPGSDLLPAQHPEQVRWRRGRGSPRRPSRPAPPPGPPDEPLVARGDGGRRAGLTGDRAAAISHPALQLAAGAEPGPGRQTACQPVPQCQQQ